MNYALLNEASTDGHWVVSNFYLIQSKWKQTCMLLYTLMSRVGWIPKPDIAGSKGTNNLNL